MSFFQGIYKALKSPYPIPETFKEEVKGLVIASLIVTGILYAFKPFGMHHLNNSAFFISLVFGGVTFFVGCIYALITRIIVKNFEHQSLGFWIVHVMGLIICIALGNVLFLVFFFGETFSAEVLVYNIMSTALIGIFPISFFGFQNQIKLEKMNAEKAKMLYDELLSKKESSQSKENVVIAIQAMENYIQIYEKEGDQLTKTTKRQTLRSVSNHELYSSLIKCHRSYFFNPYEVHRVEGNAQGLKLTMSHPECPIIPVSRSFIEVVRSSVKTHS